MREGDNEVTILVDALDGALNALKGTSEEADTLAFTTEEIGLRHEGSLS